MTGAVAGVVSYGSRPTRARRSRSEIENLTAALYDIVATAYPMTVRQVFYQAVSTGLIAKTESEYKNVVCRLLGRMRREGDLPFQWIADGTRWMRKPTTYSSLDQAVGNVVRTYRRALWDSQDARVEIWIEKEALAGVIVEVTALWDVPLMVTRGYPSLSYLHEAAEQLSDDDKRAFIYCFGDYDPSGVDIARNVEESLYEFADDADITFERIAVTAEQIETHQLPTRPTKRTDTRAKNWVGGSVELDALPPRRVSPARRGPSADSQPFRTALHVMRMRWWLRLRQLSERRTHHAYRAAARSSRGSKR